VRFDGKVALVTGGASGIGRATALGFARRGGQVAVADIDGASAANVVTEITKNGGRAIAISTDLSEAADIQAMVASTLEEYGQLDVLHNNAYGALAATQRHRVVRLEDLEQERWDHAIRIGLTAVMQAIKLTAPIMRKQGGGAIVNTSSVAGLFANAGTAAYNTVKAGVINLTRAVALEYAPDGIRANCVCPGAIDTPLLQSALSNTGFSEAIRTAIPMRRVGRAEEIADVVLFLASDLASYVTGAIVIADGGMTARSGIPDPQIG
jgi:meso-butanediol dehydrogenase / (S,S)-butanediol dehydrogenase / diacetyl reductase